MTHWKRPWCWERLKAGGGDNRGFGGWITSPTWWTWVWVSSRSWWWTGKPSMLQSVGLQRVGHDWVNELKWFLFQWRAPYSIWPGDHWTLKTQLLFFFFLFKTQLLTFPPNLLSRSPFQGVAPPIIPLPKLDTWESFWDSPFPSLISTPLFVCPLSQLASFHLHGYLSHPGHPVKLWP